MLGKWLTGCASQEPRHSKPHIPFRQAQQMLPSIPTEEELNARFGPQNVPIPGLTHARAPGLRYLQTPSGRSASRQPVKTSVGARASAL
jgi:hypothetical protein